MKEGFQLLKIFQYGEYIFYLYPNDGDEPVHVHVIDKKKSPNSPKFWMTKNGNAILANSRVTFSNYEIEKMSDAISANSDLIIKQWKKHFKDITYYC